MEVKTDGHRKLGASVMGQGVGCLLLTEKKKKQI